MNARPSFFQRIVLPGFAFKALVIGGGYATGRELATFFLPSGPRGGIYAMLLCMLIWSGVCALTFILAVQTGSHDYRTFFRHLLGPLWPVFEVAWALALVLILAVYAASAGAIGHALFGWPSIAGILLLMGCIALIAASGNDGVERLFKYVTVFLYATYVMLFALSIKHFGHRSIEAFSLDKATAGWVKGGITYAGYNMLGAVLILPVLRHITTRRDALVAGVLAGPMAMLPALLFFFCLVAFYPGITAVTLPSDFLLREIDLPVFRLVFQCMVFAALLESATGGIHAVNERIGVAYKKATERQLSAAGRLAITCLLLVGSVFLATRFGLVALIAGGYRWLSYAILAIYVLPLLTFGVRQILRYAGSASPTESSDSVTSPAALLTDATQRR